MADIETRAITDTATRWCIDEKLVDEIIQDYTRNLFQLSYLDTK